MRILTINGKPWFKGNTADGTEAVIECKRCHKIYQIAASAIDLVNWQTGMASNVCFPEMSAADRILFITGVCETCAFKGRGDDTVECPNCGFTIRRDSWYAHYAYMHPKLDVPTFQWVLDNTLNRRTP